MSNYDKQELLLSYILSNPDAFLRIRPILEPEFFDKELRGVTSYVIKHSDQYSSLPSFSMISAECGVSLQPQEDASDPRRLEWLYDEAEKFCRTQKTIAAIYDAMEKLGKGETDGIIDPLKEAVLLSLQRDLGINYWDDPKTRLLKMLENKPLPTGYKQIDDILFGGPEAGSLNLFLGGSGVGKSFFLLNIALNYLEQGYNVVYISLELSEAQIAKRLDSMVSGVPGRNIFTSIDEVAGRVRLRSKDHGVLFIKKFPQGGTNMAHIEAYYRELQLQTGLKFKVMATDYLDLFSPKMKINDMGNLFLKDKYVTEEMRGFMGENDLIGFSASQMTRGSMDTDDHRQSMVAGGISKINTADTVMSIFQNSDLKDRGKYILKFLKTRNSNGVDRQISMCFNPETMRIMDDSEGDDFLLTGSTSSSGESKAAQAMVKPKEKPNLDRVNSLVRNLGT